MPFVMPLIVPATRSGEDIEPFAQMLVILISLVVTFVTMAGLTLAWAKRVEGRQLADLGLIFTATGWAQYRRGLAVGGLFTVGLILLVTLLTVLSGFGEISANDPAQNVVHWDRLADPTLWLILLVLGLAIAIQGAAEEILCRGWLLSNVTALRGLPIGFLLSMLMFASLHPHYLFVDGFSVSPAQMLTGLFGMAAILGMGAMLAMLAIADRSIMGACGLHSGFNYSAITIALLVIILSSDEPNAVHAFVQSFKQSTDLTAVQPALVFQFLLSALVAFFLFRRFGFPRAG